jgi:microcystin-dependent protein
MARPDFSNVWGSTNAPFTAITDTDYKAGWVFRTGAPPRRVNFDYFQNLSDLRHEWLGEQMLLAVGHEWQDDVTYDAYAVVRSPVDGQLYRSLAGGNLNNEPSVSGAQWSLGVQPQSTDYLNTLRIDVASASTVDLTANAPDTRHINITGGGTINGFTVTAGQCYFATFAASGVLTNGASLVTKTGANIITAAGDSCIIRATAANQVEVLCYVKVNSTVPPGAVISVAGSTAPAGYLKANGALVSRSTYSELFAAIGTTYGAGDGSTTFALPDIRGEFLRAWDDGRGIDAGRALGSSQKGTLVSGDFDPTGTPSSMYKNGGSYVGTYGADPIDPAQYTTSAVEAVFATGSSINTAAALPDWFGMTRPRNVALLYVIKY